MLEIASQRLHLILMRMQQSDKYVKLLTQLPADTCLWVQRQAKSNSQILPLNSTRLPSVSATHNLLQRAEMCLPSESRDGARVRQLLELTSLMLDAISQNRSLN